jgi:hypothetical protein
MMRSKTITINNTDIRCFIDGNIEVPRKCSGILVRSLGGIDTNGYRIRVVSRKLFKSHRLIAMAFLPDWSAELTVDHRNGDKSDNRIENLRMLTHCQQLQAYAKPTKGATSKYRGVSWNKQSKRWVSQCQVNGKKVSLGYFDSEHDAALAYDTFIEANGYLPEAFNRNHHPELT